MMGLRMITRQAYKAELIGENVLLRLITNDSQIMQGRIVDETKHTLLIKCTQGTLRIFKKSYEITLLKRNLVLLGSDLLRRSEERIKD